jgi:PAS domain S-box-containing protein
MSRIADTETQMGGRDFVPRKRGPDLWLIVLVLVLATALVLLIAAYGNTMLLAIALVILMAAAGTYHVVVTRRNHDTITATEFQNTLFSSVAGLRARFNLIVRADGAISYYSPGYMELARSQDIKNLTHLDSFLTPERISQEDADHLRNALTAREPVTLVSSIFHPSQGEEYLRFSVYPLPRPKGFFLISVSDTERRGSRQDEDGQLQAAMDSVASLYDYAPVGAYVASLQGELLYVNAVLEQWLGYESGEVLRRRMSLYNLLSQSDGFLTDHGIAEEHHGAVQFTSQQGDVREAAIHHSLLRSAEGHPIGYQAMLIDVSAEKKSLMPPAPRR